MRKTTSHIAILAIVGLGLSACGDTSAQFYREAGVNLDEGGFGNPTMTNSLINTGQLAVAEGLSRRFANEVDSMVNFAFNSSRLDAQAQATLREQANWIRQFPEVTFRVYGHTDKVGSNAYNKRLGLRRAQAVVNYLTSQGISRSRLEAVASFGETQPLIVTEGRERRNRRTVTDVSGLVSRHPTVLNGKYAALSYRQYVNTAIRNDTNKQGVLLQE